MSGRFSNSKTRSFLEELPTSSFENDNDTITKRCKFNFSYFDVQDAGQRFSDWNHVQLVKLLDKLKDYSRESLLFWQGQRAGAGKVLTVYGNFPQNSDFQHPKHVPHEAVWCRFRLEQAVRLVGFVLPTELAERRHRKTGVFYDTNVFYVVFLDAAHRFYKTEAP